MANPTKRNYDRTSFIMIVDDDDTLLKFFKIHLNKFFSRVIVVPNASEAIETLRTREIDLVISDIRMPKMDGLQLMKKVRAHDASIPYIIVSGALLTDEQVVTCETIADGFLSKPFGVDELHNLIDFGLKRRELLKELATLLPSNKAMNEVLFGAGSVEKLAGTVSKDRAKELLGELKAKTAA